MAYSVDCAYVDYFKCAAEGKYDSGILKDRLKVTAMASGTALAGGFRTVGRVINLVTEVAKVLFYALASAFTLGKFGNANRLKDHCKLLVLNTAALVAQPLQVAMHTLAIAVGIANPKAANRLMQGASTPLAWITSQENKIKQQYNTPDIYTKFSNSIQGKMLNMFKNCSWAVEMAMTAIVTEFPEALESGLVAPLGFMNPFHLYGSNPQNLTDEQKSLTPILLLNGNFSHQATFLPLLRALQESGNKRPVYTINLPPNSSFDTDLITEKVASILKQYEADEDSPFEIDMIGHSMGSGLIQNFCQEKSEDSHYASNVHVGRVITIGSPNSYPATQKVAKVVNDVIGKKDLLVPFKGSLEDENKQEIDTGHLGLLFHPESLQAIQDFLNT